MNCTSCVLAAHLRQQGYDVNAAPMGTLGANMEKEYRKIIKNYDDITKKTTILNQKQAHKEILKVTNGADGSGALGIRWNGGGGHVFNWQVKNGEVVLYDVQPAGTIKDIDFDTYFKQTDKNRESSIYRFDTAEFDWKKLRAYVYG